MDEVTQRLRQRRQFLAPKSCQTLNQDYDDSWTMTDYNSKVDLRPRSMINEDETRNGRPPVDCVLQTPNRTSQPARTLSHITPDQLRKVTLNRVDSRNINDRSNVTVNQRDSCRTDDSTLTNNSQPNVFNYQIEHNSMESIRTFKPPPPPLPPPLPPVINGSQNLKARNLAVQEEKIRKLNEEFDRMKREDEERSRAIDEYSKEQFYESKIADMENQLKRARDQNQRYSDYTSNKLEKEVINLTPDRKRSPIHSPSIPDKSFDIEREFNEGRLNKARLGNWIDELVQDKFERASKFEAPQADSKDKKSKRKSKDRSNSDRQESRGRSRKRSESLASFKSFKSNASRVSLESVRSTTKSMKSVLFRKTEEEDLRSEISDDDVANINEGDTNFVDFAYSKFTIHGPFVDKELNVFHSICNEYNLAARFTFAKRSRFARTNPAYDRVYALIGSDKRSSWTNRSDWLQAINNLQVLDFIFRRVIRSRSRVIKEPVMVLEHFTEGSTLDNRRFRSVMRSIFKKRDHLMLTLGIEMMKFEDIR